MHDKVEARRTCPSLALWTLVDGARIFARAWKANRLDATRVPIVLVHGIAVSSRYMVPTAERLARWFDVYAPDLPGFGRSDKPRSVLTIPQLADVLRRWLDAVGISRALFVGNSNGCQVVADLAARWPERAIGLVLDSPTVDGAHRAVLPELWRLLFDMPRERWSLIPLAARDYLRAGARRALVTLRYAIDDRIEDKLPHIGLPVLIVRGERDPIVSDDWVRRLAALAPRARLVTVRGGAHALNYSRPDDFARLVESFARDECRVSAGDIRAATPH